MEYNVVIVVFDRDIVLSQFFKHKLIFKSLLKDPIACFFFSFFNM